MCLSFQFCTHQRVCILYFLKKKSNSLYPTPHLHLLAFTALLGFIVIVNILSFGANPDPDPAFQSDADPDLASKILRIHEDQDPQPYLNFLCKGLFRLQL